MTIKRRSYYRGSLEVNQVEQQLVNDKRAPMVFEASNGLVLKIRPVSLRLVRDLLNQIKEPKVPTFINEEKGGREEPNPMDPEYVEAMTAYNTKKLDVTDRAYMLHTQVVTLPEGLDNFESTEWSDELAYIGLDSIHDSGRERYVDWLKYYALTDGDFNKLQTQMLVASGLVTEEAVNAAVESFPDNPQRAALTLVSPEQQS